MKYACLNIPGYTAKARMPSEYILVEHDLLFSRRARYHLFLIPGLP